MARFNNFAQYRFAEFISDLVQGYELPFDATVAAHCTVVHFIERLVLAGCHHTTKHFLENRVFPFVHASGASQVSEPRVSKSCKPYDRRILHSKNDVQISTLYFLEEHRNLDNPFPVYTLMIALGSKARAVYPSRDTEIG